MHNLSKSLFVLGVLLISRNSFATPIIDQSYDTSIWGGGPSAALISDFQSVGQSFTAGLDGLLTRVDVDIWHIEGFNEIQLSVVPVASSGKPIRATPLATTSLNGIGTGFDNHDYYTFDLSSFDLTVTQGEMYAFFLAPVNDGRYAARGGNHYDDGLTFNGPGYLGGQAWLNDTPWGRVFDNRAYSIDLNFRTFVSTVPVPSTLSLCVFFALFMVFRKSTRPAKAII